MGVVEVAVIGTGAVLFDHEFELPEEDDEFNVHDFCDKDAYSETAPIAFFFEKTSLIPQARENQFPRGFFKNKVDWILTDLDGAIYDKEAIIRKILENIKTHSEEDEDSKSCEEFKEKLKEHLTAGKDVYFGRFMYHYFA
jgi:hypothetical protein